VAPVIALLAAGSALHGIMYLPYALQLAYGETRIPILISIILMLILTPLIIYLTVSLGSQGAAMAWLALHVLYVIIGTWLTHKHLLKGLGLTWLFIDIGTPLAVTAIVGILGTTLVLNKAQLLYERVGFGVLLILTAATLSTLLSSQMRILVLNKLGWSKNLS
jgi:O-antigen/teichoic acid export membrane protein